MGIKVIVFGSDNSGKTTLCESIVKDNGMERIKPLGPAAKNEQIKYMMDNMNKDNIIFDRFPAIEEIVCGNVFRGKSNFDLQELEYYLQGIDLIIFCKPSTEDILNWGDREQMSGVKENIFKLLDRYKELFYFMESKNYPIIKYNWRNENEYKNIIKKIREVY